jgi:ParB family chromosome partitioning protein
MTKKAKFHVRLDHLEQSASTNAPTPLVGVSEDAAASSEHGDLRHVAPHLLQDNPLNARRIYLNASLRLLADDMKLRGQLTPVRAIVRDEQLILVDGHRRVKAARLAGLTSVRVEVVDAPQKETDLYFDSLAANLHREPPTPLDDALIWGELLEKKGKDKEKLFKTQDALAEALRANTGRKVTQENISKTLALRELDEGVRDACVGAGLISLRYLYALLQFQKKRGETAALRLVLETTEQGLSARDIENRVRSASAPSATKPHALKHKIAFRSAKGELREFDQDGRIELRIQGLAEDERLLLVQQLKSLLAPSPQGTNHEHTRNAPKARSLSPVN